MNSPICSAGLAEDCSSGHSSPRYPILTFVDRKTFNNLQGREFTISDFPKVTQNFSAAHPAISAMTQEYMRYLNNELYRILFGANLGYQSYRLSTVDSTYVRDLFISNLVNEWSTPVSFYEILPITDTEYLVVLENGFLNYLTSTKSAPEEFVLACLRCMHQFKCDKSQLTRLYLNLRLNADYHKLLAMRVR